MVMINALQLLFGFRALPGYIEGIEGSEKHKFGIIGAFMESVIIL